MLLRRIIDMTFTFAGKLRRRIRVKRRLLRERPRLVINRLLRLAVFRSLCVFVYALPSLLSVFSYDAVYGNSLRYLKEYMPEWDKTENVILRFSERIRNLHFKNLLKAIFRFTKNIPTDVGHLLSDMASLISAREKLIRQFFKSLWPPGMALKRVELFLRRHLRLINSVVFSLINACVSFLLLKVAILFVIPFLGIAALTILGMDIGVALVFLMQTVISSFVSPFLCKTLHGRILVYYQRLQQFMERARRLTGSPEQCH